jgi:hypothetical protein
LEGDNMNGLARTTWKYWQVLTVAVIGLLLVGSGLLMAALSNPKRYSLSVQSDRYIDGFAIMGLICTLVGILLFLLAVSQTTTSIPLEKRRKTNTALGMGLLFQLAGLFWAGQHDANFPTGMMLILASLPLFILAAVNYAEGKGYGKSLGVCGLFGVFGFIVLILLPAQSANRNRKHALDETNRS